MFVVSRIRECHDAGQQTDDAIVSGVAHTGRLVTSAALVLVLAFAALLLGRTSRSKCSPPPSPSVSVWDATIVRALLLPAAVSMLGERAWWSPIRRTWPARVARAEPTSDEPELAGALK